MSDNQRVEPIRRYVSAGWIGFNPAMEKLVELLGAYDSLASENHGLVQACLREGVRAGELASQVDALVTNEKQLQQRIANLEGWCVEAHKQAVKAEKQWERAEQAEARLVIANEQLEATRKALEAQITITKSVNLRLADLQAENEKLLHVGLGHMEEADTLAKRLTTFRTALGEIRIAIMCPDFSAEESLSAIQNSLSRVFNLMYPDVEKKG